jgi:hypothetical protein
MDPRTKAAGKHEVLVPGWRGKALVARTWFGQTREELADEYLRYNFENGVLKVRRARNRSSEGWVFRDSCDRFWSLRPQHLSAHLRLTRSTCRVWRLGPEVARASPCGFREAIYGGCWIRPSENTTLLLDSAVNKGKREGREDVRATRASITSL